jgi:hypothetical protein
VVGYAATGRADVSPNDIDDRLPEPLRGVVAAALVLDPTAPTFGPPAVGPPPPPEVRMRRRWRPDPEDLLGRGYAQPAVPLSG